MPFKKTTAFSAAFLAQIKASLEEEQTKLTGEIGKFTDNNDGKDTSFPEYGDNLEDNAQEVTDYLSNKPVEIALEKSLRDVKSALKRVAEGTYGICKYCDKPIAEKRLQARPTSSSCVDCKKTLTDEA